MGKPNVVQMIERLLSRLYGDIDAKNFMIEDNSNLVIYHYTSLQSALSIFESKSIYASDVRYLNDSKEVEYGNSIFATQSAELMSKADIGKDIKRQDITHYLRMFYGGDSAPSYAACFCANGDLLSQWRAYGRDGGISIGFAARVLDATKFHLSKVIYNLPSQNDLVRRMLGDIVDIIVAEYDKLSFDELIDCVAETTGPISSFAVPLKDPAFVEEQEYRLYTSKYETSHSTKINRRAIRNFIIDYLEISFTAAEWKKAIKEVIVGPSSVSELRVRNVKEFLEAIRLPDVSVRASQIPFRD